MSLQYPLVEVIMAGLVVLAYWYAGGQVLPAVLIAGSLFFFVLIAGVDIHTQTMRVEYALIAGTLAILGNWLLGVELMSVLWGIVSGAAIILAVRWLWYARHRFHGMGDGDVYIAGAVGALVGWPASLVMIFVAAFSGALGGSLLLFKKKPLSGAKIAFGPYLIFGGIVALLWGHRLLDWYTEWSGIAHLFS